MHRLDMWNETAQSIQTRQDQLEQAMDDHIRRMWENDLKGKMEAIVQAVCVPIHFQILTAILCCSIFKSCQLHGWHCDGC